MSEWLQTDDLQYSQKIKEGIYRFAEARYAENKYIICKGEIIIKNWLDSDNEYDADCKTIIQAYYSSVDNFLETYPDAEIREQVLAEMLFEETAYRDTDKYEIVSMDEVEEKLQAYLD